MKRFPSYLVIVTALVLTVLSCRISTGVPTESLTLDQTAIPEVTVEVTPEVDIQKIPPAVDIVSFQDTLVQLYEMTNPGVVSIRVLTESGGGQGSGFVIDAEGHIITNYHVVEGQTDLEVAFPSGLKVRGNVVGTDLDSDLAVIKVAVPVEELHPLTLGDSSQVKIGQTVIAIGNPFGLAGTMTMGIVSGLGRTIESLHSTADGGTFSAADVIQTDAAINPGNSGGPLINLNGEVIGVNESIRTTGFNTSGQPINSGVGFAISINIIKRVVPYLIKIGSYDYPYLGITSLNEITLLTQEALGLPRSSGVYITSVVPGGPAEKAGVHAGNRETNITGLRAGGDLIITIDNQPVRNYNDLIGYLVQNKSPGDKVVLTILREGKEIQIEITLDKRPAPTTP